MTSICREWLIVVARSVLDVKLSRKAKVPIQQYCNNSLEGSN